MSYKTGNGQVASHLNSFPLLRPQLAVQNLTPLFAFSFSTSLFTASLAAQQGRALTSPPLPLDWLLHVLTDGPSHPP